MSKQSHSRSSRSTVLNRSDRRRATRAAKKAGRFSPLEALEDRRLFSTYLVTSAADSGIGSLRQAILDANAHQGADVIDFNIASDGPVDIQLSEELPAITDQVKLDGTTEVGYAGAPLVTIDGSALAGGDGLTFTAGSSTVQGLAITGFTGGAAIVLNGDGGNTIRANYIGLDATGSTATGSNKDGIVVNSEGNTIGGLNAADANVISNNGRAGILILGSNTLVQGNFIGTDPTGTMSLGNGAGPDYDPTNGIFAGGVLVLGGTGSVIGGPTTGARNVISGNWGDGIDVSGVALGNFIQGNYIGVDAGGETALPNMYGIYVQDAAITIGGSSAGEGNVISGNHANGIDLDSASGNVIQGNLIGTDALGTSMVDNWGNGILIEHASSNNAINARNIISGNDGDGIRVQADALTSGNVIHGNYIGLNSDGSAALGNYGNGISIAGSGVQVTGNVISGNHGYGIAVGFTEVDPNTFQPVLHTGDNNRLTGNVIGMLADGHAEIGNGDDGIHIDGSNNTISGNTIVANGQPTGYTANGVTVASGTGNAIRANRMWDNTGLGIDLGSVELGTDGVTPNDSTGHGGPNLYQNFPVIVTAELTGSTLTVTGTLNCAPGTYSIDLFANTAAGPGGYGQGRVYLGTVDVIVGATGGTFTGTFTNVSAALPWITATATDAAGNTSEFGLSTGVSAGQLSSEGTTMALSSSANPAVYGRSVTFTANVTGLDGSVPQGSVIFFVDGEAVTGSLTLINGVATYTTSALRAGDHAITARFTPADGSYTGSDAGLTEHISPAVLTITANNKTMTYGGLLPVLTDDYSGLVNGDNVAVTISTVSAHSHAGTYTIELSAAYDPNYTITVVPGTLTITPAALTITANNQNMTYGGTMPGLTASYSGFVNGDSAASLTTNPALSTVSASSHAGTYAITASGAVDGDYTISYIAGSLTIGKATLTITANNQTMTYGGMMPTLAASYSGLVNGDTASRIGGLVLSTVAASSDAGSYAITASGATDGDYAISYAAGTLRITPAALTITADSKTMTYGGVMPALTATYSGLVNGDTAASLNAVLSTVGADSHVGTYAITASGAASSNYAITFAAGTLTITPAAITITAPSITKTYGAPMPVLKTVYDGLVNGDSPADLGISFSPVDFTGHVGNYSITGSGAGNADYAITFVAGTLTVTPATLTITAGSASKLYGAAMPALTVTYSGFANGDSAASLSALPHLATAATAGSHVGTYAIAASGAVDSDYTITYVAGTLSVTPATLTITPASASKVYGAALPTFTATYSGFVNGDSAASLTTQAALATMATAGSHVGTYAIAASGAVDSDYTITYVAGTLSVTPATLIVTPAGASKVYGAAMPTLTATYSGFVNGDSAASLTTQATLATTATAGSHVGTYTITATGAVDGDYTITYVAGTLSVTPATLIVTPAGANKVYGAAMPTLTATYSGFVNGDSAATLTTQAALTTTATAGSHVGSYSINAIGAADSDYVINYAGGTLTVTPAALIITPASASKLYGAAMPTLTATYSGFVNGDSAASLTTQAALATAATSASHVGTYAITASGAADGDYTISYAAGTLTITPATLTITANNKTMTYGGTMPALTASYAGLVNGDTAGTVPATLSTVAAGSHAGTYAITLGGAVDADYTISMVSGTLTITPAALTIIPANASKVYGATMPTFAATYSGLVNGDTAASLTTRPALATTATSASHVGSYAITASGAVDSDYTITYAAGALTVTPAALTISADNKTMTAGGTMPVLTATYAGLVNGDTAATVPATLSTVSASSPAGAYAINISGASDPDYTITLVPGTLTITAPAGGSLSGQTWRDITGNGTSSDDTLLAGVTVNLYRDSDGDGVLDTTDALVATTISDGSGAYSFSNEPAGSYFVREVVPTGYVRTVPELSDSYAVSVSKGSSAPGLDFDNYKQCTATVSNVTFKVTDPTTGTQTVTDLRGHTQQGDTVTVTFTIGGTNSARITLVSYDAPTPTFDASLASEQTIYQQDSEVLTPGVHTLTVTIPTNYYQIDFVKCYAIDTFGPAGSNIFYSAQGRLISADNAGTHSDVDQMTAATEFWGQLGQSLIKNFNVSAATPSPKVLGNWLAQNFPSLYGSCGSYSLVNKNNSAVASLFQTFYKDQAHHKTDASVLATALNVYASTIALGGDVNLVGAYGFNPTDDGLGQANFNVLNNGAAFGVANNSTLSVWQLLQAANSRSRNDVLYNGASSMLTLAYNMFESINNAGGIV